MRKTSWRIAQGVVGAVILIFVAITIRDQWNDVQRAREQPVQWDIHWEFIAAALVMTWAMYVVLIWGWRAVLIGWREWLRIADAARIWTISSLGSYIPGKLWSIAGMAMMAQQSGVSGTAAMGSAVIMQLISIATGAAIAVALVGTVLLDDLLAGWGSLLAIGVAALALLGAVALTSPSLTRRIGFLLRRPDAIRPVDPNALAAALFANVVAWGGYGIALQLLAVGTLHGVNLSWATATGAFAASYIIGFLAILLPAGIGVREGILIVLLAPTIGVHQATALAVISRCALTVNQLGAALPFLLFRRKPRDLSIAT